MERKCFVALIFLLVFKHHWGRQWQETRGGRKQLGEKPWPPRDFPSSHVGSTPAELCMPPPTNTIKPDVFPASLHHEVGSEASITSSILHRSGSNSHERTQRAVSVGERHLHMEERASPLGTPSLKMKELKNGSKLNLKGNLLRV